MTCEVFLSNVVDTAGREGNILSYIFNVFPNEEKARLLFTRRKITSISMIDPIV